MIAAGFCNGLGNFTIYTSILRCLASIDRVELVLDDGWRTETRKAVQLIAERLPFVQRVVGFPSEYTERCREFMSFHSITQSSFLQHVHRDKILERQNYVCWADFQHEQDFYLNEICKQFKYRGKIFDQYMPISETLPFDLPDAKIICISNGWSRGNEGIWRRKAYPHYAELIETILRFYDNVTVFLVGDESDAIWGRKMLVDLPTFLRERVRNVCGRLNILETAYLINRSAFGIYTDTSTAHIADALKRRGVVLYGSTLVSKNGPLNHTLTTVRSPLLCAPCQGTVLFRECHEFTACMKSIDIGIIMAIMRQNL